MSFNDWYNSLNQDERIRFRDEFIKRAYISKGYFYHWKRTAKWDSRLGFIAMRIEE